MQKPDLIGTLAYKNKNITVHRVGAEFIPDQSRQGVDAEAHIGGAAVQKITAGGGKGQHWLNEKGPEVFGGNTSVKLQAHSRGVVNMG